MNERKRCAALILCVLTAVLCGCEEQNNRFAGGTRGDEPFTFTAEGYTADAAYVLNLSSRKIHMTNCHYAKGISDDNRLYTNETEQALVQGYTYCGHCLPDNIDIEKEEDENAE